MGVQKITERRELPDTTRSYQTAINAPNLSQYASSVPGSIRKALGGLDDGLKGIGAAIELKDEADANAAARDIRGYSDHVLNVGYRDPSTGIQMKALRARTGQDVVQVADVHDDLVQRFANQRLENLSDRARRLVSTKTHDYRTSIYHDLTTWSRDKYAKFSLDMAISDYATDEDILVNRMITNRDASSLPDAAKWIAENAEAAAETGDETAEDRLKVAIQDAAKSNDEEARRDFKEFRKGLQQQQIDLYTTMVSRGLVNSQDADNRVDAAGKKTVQRMFKAYLDNGHYDRALYFLSRGLELGLLPEELDRGRQMLLDSAQKKAEQIKSEVERTQRELVKKSRNESQQRISSRLKLDAADATFYYDEADKADEVGDYDRAVQMRTHADAIRKADAEGERRDAEQAKIDKIVRGELALRKDGKTPEQNPDDFVDYYQRSSQELEESNPKGALSFLKAAQSVQAGEAEQWANSRNAEIKAQKRKNQEDVRWKMLDLMNKIDSGKDATQDQIDLMQQIDILRRSHGASPEFIEDALGRVRRMNNSGVVKGLVSFARKCGVSFEQMEGGGYSQAVRSKNGLAQVDPQWAKGGMTAGQFFDLSDRLQKELEFLGADISRPGAADKIIDAAVQEYRAKGYDAALDSISKTAYQYQIDQRATAQERAIRSYQEGQKKIKATQAAADAESRGESTDGGKNEYQSELDFITGGKR